MAASNKSLGAQIAAVIFALISVICGAGWYMAVDKATQDIARAAKAEADLKKEQNVSKQLLTDIDQLKQVTGHNQQNVGTVEQADGDTVVGGNSRDIAAATQDGAMARTTKEAISSLIQEKARTKADADAKTAAIDAEKRSYDERVANIQKDLDQAKVDLQAAVGDRAKAQKDKAEEVRAKQEEITTLSKELNTVKAELADAKTAWDNERKKYDEEIGQYNTQIDRLRERLKSLTRVSFEVPDGFITWVDNTARTVSINLGEADGLRTRTSFSVYRKEHNGVGRDAEDIKAQIEVIKITGAHRAEARILEDDIYQPITRGDPIYTPLWSPGITEKFAIVGTIDLDKDGISDRTRFHDIVSAAGGTITQEVLDDGKRIRYTAFPSEFTEWTENDPQLESDVKYFIIANIPDPSLAVRPEDKEVRSLIGQQLKAMRDEGRRVGVEEITLNNFLLYIGYKPERRLYLPGATDRPFTLKSGATSTTVGESTGDRTSAGATSGIYGRSKRLKPQSSDNSGKK